MRRGHLAFLLALLLALASPVAAAEIRIGVAVDRDRAALTVDGGVLAWPGQTLTLGKETVLGWVVGAGSPQACDRIAPAA